jgi:hypothetical protein
LAWIGTTHKGLQRYAYSILLFIQPLDLTEANFYSFLYENSIIYMRRKNQKTEIEEKNRRQLLASFYIRLGVEASPPLPSIVAAASAPISESAAAVSTVGAGTSSLLASASPFLFLSGPPGQLPIL